MKITLASFAKVSLAAALALTMTVNADAQRKSWDFTKWSAATVNNLKAVNTPDVAANTREWSDVEKAADTQPTDATKDNCFWEWLTHGSTTEDKYITANGQVISELEGLYYTNTSLGSLAIAVNYPETSLGTYNGPSYLWFGGSKKLYFVIPNVPLGETIKMGVESHKSTDARGVELYVGRGTAGPKLVAPDGTDVAIPTTYQDLEWQVPATIDNPDLINEDGTVDIQIYNTNGCHVYYIQVGDGGTPPIEEARKVAYITNTESGAFDDAQIALEGAADLYDLTVIESTSADVTLDSLQKFEAIVVSPYVGVGDAMVAVLKSAIAYQPMLNLNPALYSTWALGEIAESDTPTLAVSEAYLESPLFTDIDLSDGLQLQLDGAVPYVKLGSYFADDAVIATAGEGNVAIHQHNADRNSYIFVPVTDGVMNPEVLNTLVINATSVVADTKKAVSAASAPGIKLTYGDMITNVAITAPAVATVYYTIDGTEPTVESKIYTEPFDVKENITVKAFATMDGYLPSSVASADVIVKAKAATPVIAMSYAPDATTVTISCTTADAALYYTFWDNGAMTTATTAKYEEPIVVTGEPTYIYAFAAGDEVITSDVASDYVAIEGIDKNTIRMDTVSHFSASEAAWMPAEPYEGSTGAAKAHYYWGKNAWSYYSTNEADIVGYKDEIVKDENGDSIGIKQVPIYAADPEAVRTMYANEGMGMENDWRLFSQGQVLTGELQSSPSAIIGNGATGYYYEEATDLIGGPATKGMITFGGKGSGEPYTGAIESTVQFATPFDVVVYIGNGNSGSAAQMEVQVSADGKEWTKAGDLKLAATQRYVKKNRVSVNEGGKVYVRVAQAGGGSKAQVYDIYVLNNGELSQQYEPTSGIEEVVSEAAAEVKSVEVYTLNGMRVAEPRKGINIIRTVMTDGKVKVEKVIVR